MTFAGTVILKKGKELSLQRYHPWIFSGAINHIEGEPADGSWVEVKSAGGATLGYGHYQQGSITVRMLHFGVDAPDENYFERMLQSAVRLRKSAGLPNAETNAFRLVHGEGDGMPGLVVDYYDGCAVVQSHSYGMHEDRLKIAQALTAVLGPLCKAVYYRSQISASGKQKPAQLSEYLHGSASMPAVIQEYGSRYFVDWEEGQKTGFFIDQRENRQLLKKFSDGKNVLNTFCYTGGFSVTAIEGGAKLVHSVDVSEKAVELTRNNIKLNGFDTDFHASFASDTFDFFKGSRDEYDVIILDPPAFAKHRDARHQAVRGYQRLNAAAMKVIRPGGILFTFSCSQVVDRQLFYNTVVAAAIQAGRKMKVLHHLSQPADHPVSIFHPEGEYLKGLVLYID